MQFSLFDFEEQLQTVQLVTAVLPDPTDSEVAEVLAALEPETPPQPAYREREWLLKEAEGKPGSVTLVRIKRKYIAVVPLDLDAALMLDGYRHSEAAIETTSRRLKNGNIVNIVLHNGSDGSYTAAHAQHNLIRACSCDEGTAVPVVSTTSADCRVYFPFENAFADSVKHSFLYQHLFQCGFNVILTPSFERWVRKEYFRTHVEQLAFDLPEIKDKRPLFDQMEEGLLVVCTQAKDTFELGQRYIVAKITDENGSENGVQFSKVTGEGDDAVIASQRLTWYNTTPMDDYFVLEAGTEVVYDPATSVAAQYPKQFEAAKAKLEAMGMDLYLHTVYDAAQASLKRNYICAKPQRMGKTSEAIATALMWGSKRIAFVSPSKDTREEVQLEMQRLGITDFVLVDKLADLEQDARFYLMYYGFVKGLEDDPAPRGNDKFQVQARCPHCNEFLVQFRHEDIGHGYHRFIKELDFGYRCENKVCSYTEVSSERKRVSSDVYRGSKAGAAWWDLNQPNRFVSHAVLQLVKNQDGVYVPDGTSDRHTGSGYVDYERAKMAAVFNNLKNKFRHTEVSTDHPSLLLKGRINKASGYVNHAWAPARYKRFRKRFGTVIVDEIHMLANANTDQSQAVLGLQAKHKIGLTGTLMPNGPQDPYWPCHWTFGGGTALFPYFRGGENGSTKYWKTFCKNLVITNAQGEQRRKKLPIAIAPLKQRKLHAPLLIRRTFADPLVTESLLAKGFFYPTVHYHTVPCTPDPHQASLLVNAMDRFQEAYNSYVIQQEEEGHEVNQAYVLSSMSLLKVAATCPDFLNLKLEKAGVPEKIYTGTPGGGKTAEIRRIAYDKLERGEKVVIVSFYKHELDVLAKALEDLNPIHYDPEGKWDSTERFACRQDFLHNPRSRLLLGSIQKLQVGVDLSSANTVICSDLLWSPGKQDQAVARILKPLTVARDCEIYYMVLKHSLDEHVFNVFYSKRVSSEQVLDGMISTPRPTDFNVKAFVDLVLSERSSMASYALDLNTEENIYVPMLNMLATLSERE